MESDLATTVAYFKNNNNNNKANSTVKLGSKFAPLR